MINILNFQIIDKCYFPYFSYTCYAKARLKYGSLLLSWFWLGHPRSLKHPPSHSPGVGVLKNSVT